MSDITRDSTVSRNPDVLHREIEDEAVLLDPESGTYYTLNETGTAIWNLIEEPTPLTDVLAKLREEFDVSEEDAWSGLLTLVGDFAEHGLVSVE